MNYFIPQNLNLDELIKKHPPVFKQGFHRDCFIFLLGQITEVAARYRDMVDDDGFVPLNAKVLKQRVYNYNEYLEYLIYHGIIECDNRYVPGEKSLGYKFSSKYDTEPVCAVTITKHTLVKNLKSKGNYEKNMIQKYDYLNKWFEEEEGLKIDYDLAIQKLELLRLEDILRCKKNPHFRFNANLVNASRIKEHDFYFRIDEKAGRLHTNLTALKKQLRTFLTYNGEPLACIDIVCAQPTGILNLISPEFYEKRHDNRITYHNIRASIREQINFEEVWKHIKTNPADFELFRQDVLSDFYESFREKAQRETGCDLDRDDMKTAVFKVLYSENAYFRQKRAGLKRLFAAIYPSVYSLLCAFKTNNESALPVLLQNLEAQVILDRVAKRISKVKPLMPLFTIHDSIMVPQREVIACKDIFSSVYREALGITPNLRVESATCSSQLDASNKIL